MKKQHGILIIAFVGLLTAGSVEQEFVKKIKKIYPSKQQCLELYSDKIITANRIFTLLADIQKSVASMQQKALSGINDYYVDDTKNCFLQQANKDQLFDHHAQEVKDKGWLERTERKLTDILVLI